MEQPTLYAAQQTDSATLTNERLLRILERTLWIAGALYALRVLMAGNSDWGVIGVVLAFAALTLLCWLIGVWTMIWRSQRRRKAGRLLVISASFLVAPLILRSTMGGPLSASAVAGAAAATLVALLIWAMVSPSRVAAKVPDILFHSRVLNYSLLALVVIGWLLPIGMVIALSYENLDTSSGQGSPGMGLAVVIVLFAAWFIGSGCISVLIAVWGWLGLRRRLKSGLRRVHIAQIIAPLPGIAAGALALALFLIQGTS